MTARGTRRGTHVLAAAGLFGLLLLAACGGRRGADEPAPLPAPVDLTGATVMLLPVQAPAPAGLDAELAFWFQERAPRTTWLLPAELQRIADRSPAWTVRLDALPGGISETGGQRRVHDPLYGQLRRLGAQTDARLAVLPLAGRAVQGDLVVSEISAILIDLVGGRVLWIGAVRVTGTAGQGPSAAAVAEALARALLL